MYEPLILPKNGQSKPTNKKGKIRSKISPPNTKDIGRSSPKKRRSDFPHPEEKMTTP
jgi:hypothetical protein